MADKNTYEANLAEQIHAAERAVGEANLAGAGPNRIEKILRAQDRLTKLEDELQRCLDGRAYPTR
jgi:hypothetical protein